MKHVCDSCWKCERCRKERPKSQMQPEGDSYECTVCLAEIEQKIIAFVARSPYGFRNEDVIFTHILGRNHWADKEPTLGVGTRVADILFNLVKVNRLLWRTTDDTGEKPLRYSIPTADELAAAKRSGELDSDVLPAQVVTARRTRLNARRARHANQQDSQAQAGAAPHAHRVQRN